MRIRVHVKPRAKVNKVERVSEREFSVWVTAPPTDNKANEAVQALLADFFGVAKSRITLIRGAASRHKVFEVAR